MHVLLFPCTLVVRPDAKRLAFRAMKRSLHVLCIIYFHGHLSVLMAHLFHAVSEICSCIHGPRCGRKPWMTSGMVLPACETWYQAHLIARLISAPE